MFDRPREIILLLLVMLGYTAFMIWTMARLFRGLKQNELVQQQRVLEAKFQAEKEVFEAKQEIQEETFKQISRELHDNVGQTFSLAKLGLANLPLEDLTEARATIIEITDILGKGISDLRDISKSINAEFVQTAGLRMSIETQLGFLERTGRYQISFECAEDLSHLDTPIVLVFYRILQESLNNIIRHAKASEISIRLSLEETKLKLSIEDNGTGFDREPTTSAGSRQGGISNMKVRAKTIGADVQIYSQLGQGTRITITSNQAI